ncbi:galectin-7 [Biomphalaria pfeifferi]|uniref:Galectin n=1 Tax=Biomphalaria pfeifferi TaxID=112525 RepID=A0AAD8EY66_BIOPF|nr:galectin-7 [Biomphalaria pfeifferi]
MASVSLEKKGEGHYEHHGTPVPCSISLPTLHSGTKILIEGKTLPNAKGFSVNFCAGHNLDHDIAFHYNPRLEMNRVVSNTKHNGGWGAEEISNDVPFGHDKPFKLKIKLTNNGYEVEVSKGPAIHYNHRLPLDKVTHLYLHGDISVSLIKLKAKK